MQRGFTLLEVMLAGLLLSFLTAGAMAAYIAQVKATNTETQVSTVTDQAREAVRLISNELRTAGPGMNAALAVGGSSQSCATGTIPYDPGTGSLACLPPVFRSNSPMAPLGTSGLFPSCVGGVANSAPGYQLSLGTTTLPSGSTYFCPDDLVIVEGNSKNPFFVSNLPGSSLSNTTPANFGFMQQNAGGGGVNGFDTSAIGALQNNPLVMIAGAQGPALFNMPASYTPTYTSYSAATDGTTYGVCYATTPVTLSTTSFDLFGNIGSGTPVAMPARLVQYAIEPVDAKGQAAPIGTTFVSANLVRNILTPTLTGFTRISTAVLVQGVVDMQVEFGYDPQATGQLQYVSSGGYQEATWVPPGALPIADTTYNSCLPGSAAPEQVFAGTCFPSLNQKFLRSVRFSLLVRSPTIPNARSQQGMASAAGTAPPFLIQPAIQNIVGGNVEAQNWGWAPGFLGVESTDGADYRQISTEVFIRNLGLSTSY